MKPNTKMLFGNIFDDRKIIPNYLARFAEDVIAKLQQNNANKEFNTVLDPLVVAIVPLRLELGQVDTSFNSRVGKTATLDGFVVDFTTYMKDNYIFIAAALGGDKTPAFKEFYPQGKTEYSTITKTKIPTVMERLKTVAISYQTQLGATISTQLQDFQTEWTDLRGSQLQQKSAVETNRSDRTLARRGLEKTLLKTIHFIADKYPGEEEKCAVFFDFNLLFGVQYSSKEVVTKVS